MLRRKFGAVLLGSTAALAYTAVNAQATDELTEIVITGSRVIKNGDDSPTPVTVVTVEDIQATRPTTVYEGLLDMPQLSGSRGQAASNPGGAGANNNNINAPNLRGLGSIRTLVLYDGHRMPPTQQDFLQDANLIPQMLLQRVDVVTGGASAVYGSDAMGGVVNFITDRKFNGLKMQARGGISDYSDDNQYDFGVAFGTDLFGGRGHFEGSLQVNDDRGIMHRTDRPSLEPRWTTQGTCSPAPPTQTCATPFYLVPYATISNYSFGGKIMSNAGAFTLNHFASNGVASPFNVGTAITGTISQGGDGAYNTGSSLKARLGFQQAYGRFDFDVTDNLHWYTSLSATKTHQLSYNGDSRVSINLSSTNPYLPANVAGAMTATTFQFNKLWGGNNPAGGSMVPTQNGDLWVNFLYINTGLEGSLGDYKWDVAYTYGDSKQHARQNAGVDYGRFLAASDAVRDSSGNIVCYDQSSLGSHLYAGCVPVNLFGPTSESQAAIDYFVRPIHYRTRNRMDDVAANISGAPFEGWAGPIDMALSAEVRKLTYELTSGALPATVAPLSCAGLRFGNCSTNVNTPTNQWLFGSSANRPPVDETVSEVALEGNIPVLSDMAWAKAVDVNAATRYARYSIHGNTIITDPAITRTFNALTWKTGLTWHFNDEWTMRASRSRDFRAPNLDELFRPASIANNTGFIDVVTGTVPVGSVVQTSGNPKLDPEIAYQTTLGFVYKPTADFSAALDAYTARVKGFIPSGPNGVSGTNQTFQNVCLLSGGTSPYCALIERNSSGLVTKFYSTYINLGEQRTAGIDLELNYKTNLFNNPLSLRTLVAYQPHVIYTQPGVNDVDAAGTINGAGAGPVGGKVRVSLFARYSLTEHVTVDWLTRWRSALHHNTDVNQKERDPRSYSPATAWSNLNVAYQFEPKFGGQASLYFNVTNLFNQVPHPVAFSGAQAEPGLFGGLALGDDPVGRYYSVGVRYKL